MKIYKILLLILLPFLIQAQSTVVCFEMDVSGKMTENFKKDKKFKHRDHPFIVDKFHYVVHEGDSLYVGRQLDPMRATVTEYFDKFDLYPYCLYIPTYFKNGTLEMFWEHSTQVFDLSTIKENKRWKLEK